MKKTLFALAIIAAALFIVGCSSDTTTPPADDTNMDTENDTDMQDNTNQENTDDNLDDEFVDADETVNTGEVI